MKKGKSIMEAMDERAIEIGEMNGCKYFIIPAPMEDALNGYVVFDKKPVIEPGYDGILTYVPVHGGITFYKHEKEGSIYGFDTLHYDSAKYPRSDKKWIKEQISIMIAAIKIAAIVEKKYLKCVTNKGKAKWAQMVQDVQPEMAHNFGVSLKLLAGKL